MIENSQSEAIIIEGARDVSYPSMQPTSGVAPAHWSNWLDRPFLTLVRWDGEKMAWAILLALALLSRVIGLGNRAISHDESLHALYAFKLFTGQGYQHEAMMHGPLKFELTALIYFIFGVGDWSARLEVALFGVLMVGLLWMMRPWLGRIGAFLAAVMYTISPALLFHSRYIRDEVMLCALLVLFVICLFRYLEKGTTRWLLGTAVALALALTTMEASFIFGAIFGAYLGLALAARLWVLAWPAESGRRPYRIALGIALPALTAGILLLAFRQTVPGLVLAGAGAVALCVAAGLAVAGWRSQLRFFRELDLLVFLLTLVLPFLAAVPMRLLHWSLDPFKKVTALSLSTMWQGWLTMLVLLALSAVVGWYWFRKRWLVAAALFWAIELLLFTTLLTNGLGIGTGIIGSLGYWIDQQEVMRGGQPWYYFLLLVPLYEFLPLLFSIGGAIAWLLRRRSPEPVAGAVGDGADPSGPGSDASSWSVRSEFLTFLVFWVMATWAIFTYVGEKMPWHVVYFTTPMALLGGWWLGQVIEGIDWPWVRRRGGLWLLLGVPVFLFVLKAIFPVPSRRPFADISIVGLANTVGWFVALAFGIALLWFGIERIAAIGWRQSLRLIVVALAAILGIYTVGVAYRFAYINYDYPTEPMVYAHGTPDLKLVMDRLEEISRKTVGGRNLKVAYDEDALWPLEWYLRDYPNRVYYGSEPSRAALDAPVVLVGSAGLDKARPYLGNRYYELSYRQIWWPRETYKDLTWDRIWNGIKDPKQRGQFWDVVLQRRYTTPAATWEVPFVHRFSLFIRKDIADEIWLYGAPAGAAAGGGVTGDVYAKGQKPVTALQQIGTGVAGSEAGQMNAPRAVALGPDGNLYVADSGNDRIQVYGADGKLLRQWGSTCKLIENNQGCEGDGRGQFAEPWGIAVGADGSVYVADTWNSRVQKFDSQGQFERMWGTFQSTNGELTQPGALYGPRGIAVGADGNVYVMDTGNKRVQGFKPDGTFVGQWGGGGVIEGKFDEPVGLAQDGQGNWYVTDTWNHRVQKFDKDWNYVGQWAIEGWASQSVVNKPYVAVDAGRGLVYVSDPEGYRVLVFGLDGAFRGTWGQYGNDMSSLTLPTGLAVGPDGKVWVADGGAHRLLAFPPWQ